MKLLPIGIQTFRDIIEGGFYYVDKTHFIPKLTSKYYFLSRPRRFGKSLFLDTLKEAFSGNKELLKGYIYTIIGIGGKDKVVKDKEVYLIGIEFSKEKKNIVSFEWEKYN